MADMTRRRVLQVLASAPFAAFAGGCGQGVLGGSSGLGSSGSGSSGSGASGTSTTATVGGEVSIPYPLYGLNTGTNLAHLIGNTAFMETFGKLGRRCCVIPAETRQIGLI